MDLVGKTAALLLCLFLMTANNAYMATAQAASSSELLGQKAIKTESAQNLPRWGRIQQATTAARFNNPTKPMQDWNSFIAETKNDSTLLKMIKVNNFVNRVTYKQDNWIYNKDDYWASPAELFKNGGDCEDYAITKYFTLRQLGFSASDLKIAMVYDVYSGTDHAFLTVRHNNATYVLDNREKLVVSRYMKNRYKPHYAFNEDKVWFYNSPVMVQKMRKNKDGSVMAGNR